MKDSTCGGPPAIGATLSVFCCESPQQKDEGNWARGSDDFKSKTDIFDKLKSVLISSGILLTSFYSKISKFCILCTRIRLQNTLHKAFLEHLPF